MSAHRAGDGAVWTLHEAGPFKDCLESPAGFVRHIANARRLEAAFGPFDPPLPAWDAEGEREHPL